MANILRSTVIGRPWRSRLAGEVRSIPMTSFGGLLRAIHGVASEQTLAMPILTLQGARALGQPLSIYLKEASRLAEGQIALKRRFPLDVVFAFPHPLEALLPWGTELAYRDDGPPVVARNPRGGLDELLAGPTPEAAGDPRLAGTLAAARALAGTFTGELPVVGAVLGPFSLLALLLGKPAWRILLDTSPAERMSHLPRAMERLVSYTAGWAEAQRSAGCDLIMVYEPFTAARELDEEIALTCALPALASLLRRAPAPLGLCLPGHCMALLPHLRRLEFPIVAISAAESIDCVRRALGATKALLCGLDGAGMLTCSPEELERKSRNILDLAGPGFILGSAEMELPWIVSDAQIDAVFRAAHASREATIAGTQR